MENGAGRAGGALAALARLLPPLLLLLGAPYTLACEEEGLAQLACTGGGAAAGAAAACSGCCCCCCSFCNRRAAATASSCCASERAGAGGLVPRSKPCDATTAGAWRAAWCGPTRGLPTALLPGLRWPARACTVYASGKPPAAFCCCGLAADITGRCGSAGALLAGEVAGRGGSGGRTAAPHTSKSGEPAGVPLRLGAAVPGRFSRPVSELELVRIVRSRPAPPRLAGGVAWTPGVPARCCCCCCHCC